MSGAGEQVYLAGYFPKLPAGWPAAARVDEICSVSTCLSASRRMDPPLAAP